MPYAIFYCPYCGKSERKSSDLVQYDGDTIKMPCGSSVCRQKQREEQEINDKERKKREIDEELENLRRQKQQAEEDKNRQLREAELEHNPEVHEAEAKTGKSCWARSDFKIPIKGTCEKCKSSNQVIFEPKLKKVNPIGQEVFTNYLCADCYCKEEGVSPGKYTPSGGGNFDKPTRSSFSTPQPSSGSNNFEGNCVLCKKNLSRIEKNCNYFTEEPNWKFCETCWPKAQEHKWVSERIARGSSVSETDIDNNSRLSQHSKNFFKVLIKAKQGEDGGIDSLSISPQEKQDLWEIYNEAKNKPKKKYTFKCHDCGKTHEDDYKWNYCYHCNSKNVETFQDGVKISSANKNKSLPSLVIGIIVIGVIGLVIFIIVKLKKRKRRR